MNLQGLESRGNLFYHCKTMRVMILSSTKSEYDAAMEAAKLLLASIRTAPKSHGLDTIFSCIVTGDDKQKISDWLKAQKKERGPTWERDGICVGSAHVLVLVGVKSEPLELDCGACGFKDCASFKKAKRKEGKDFLGPNCIFKILDLGIALGSAAKTASILNMDNRLFYTAGTAARHLGYLKGVDVVIGIPLAITGKSPFFDR
jgi:uncharacterized ferredoxin-like protein